VFRYSLCGETIQNPHGEDEWSYVHFFVMWDVDKKLIDDMAADLLEPGAFPEAETPKSKVVSRKVVKALPACGNLKPLSKAGCGYRQERTIGWAIPMHDGV
jgi:hypothetical protein